MKYKFRWWVKDGLSKRYSGEDIVETNEEIDQHTLEEMIDGAAGSGYDEIRDRREKGHRLGILIIINTCDVACDDWKILSFRRIKDDKPKI